MKQKAILSVSFGTKDPAFEKKTIDVLEKEYKKYDNASRDELSYTLNQLQLECYGTKVLLFLI